MQIFIRTGIWILWYCVDERMMRYMVSNTKGSFIKGDMISRDADTIVSAPDTTKQKIRMPAIPHSSARTQ